MDEIYDDLPADSEEAFLLLEEAFQADLKQQLANLDEREDGHLLYVQYISRVLAAIGALEIDAAFNQRVPAIEDVDYSTYLNFNKDVVHYITRLRILKGRRNQGHSVRFDSAAREKIRHYLEQVREIFSKLEIDERKREALLKKVSVLELEIDRVRTRFDAFGALVIESAGLLGDSAEKLSPITKILDSVAKVIWGAKAEEEAKQLPPPEKPKQIRGPSGRDNSSDEGDIPF